MYIDSVAELADETKLSIGLVGWFAAFQVQRQTAHYKRRDLLFLSVYCPSLHLKSLQKQLKTTF